MYKPFSIGERLVCVDQPCVVVERRTVAPSLFTPAGDYMYRLALQSPVGEHTVFVYHSQNKLMVPAAHALRHDLPFACVR